MASRGGRGDARGRGDRGRGDGGGRGRGDGGGRGRGDGGRGRGDAPRGRGQTGDRGGGRGRGDMGALPFRSSEIIFGLREALVPPDAKVTSAEDKIVANQKSLTDGISALGLACRPAHATEGQSIVLRTNYFNITPRKDISLYRYSIEMVPQDEKRKDKLPDKGLPRRTRRRLMELLLEKATFKQHAASVATDYSSTVISAVKLNLGDTDEKTAPVTYFEKEETEPRNPPLKYDCTVKGTGVIKINDLMAYLFSVEPIPMFKPDPDEEITAYSSSYKGDAIQALNIIMSKKAEEATNIVAYGQNKFYGLSIDPEALADLGGALIAIRGYYCSVRTSTRRLLVNINVCTSPFYQPGTLSDVMQAYMGARPPPTLMMLAKFLRGLKVETRYLKNSKGVLQTKVKTIWGLAREPKFGANAREHKFNDNQSGKVVTVEDFFKYKHNIRLVHPQAYLVNVGNHEKPVLIPPEVCTVRPGQRHNGALTPSQTSQMIKVACRPPGENAQHIMDKGAPLMGFTGDENNPLKTIFGLTIIPQMMTVPARILQPPQLTYANGPVRPSGGNWNMMNKIFSVAMPVKNWSYLIIQGGRTDVSLVSNTVRIFKNSLNIVGMQADNPNPQAGYTFQLDEKRGRDDIRSFDMILGESFKRLESTLERSKQAGVKILLVILPTESPDIYARIKYFGDVKFGIHTVCCQESKITREGRGQAQYMANVALKFNLKLGGINQSLKPNQMGILSDNKTIILGIDVTHPSPGSQKGAPSVAGVVSNLNGRCGQWPASLKIQEGRVEMVSDLTQLVMERLQHWKRKNNSFPINVLVYRDGVSEGQYALVLQHEYPAILEACRRVGFQARPKVSIIICGKRHHTRFFPTKGEDGDKNGNPKNGTVVDRGVVREREWGFFLQAHTALKGTAKSCNYAIIKDEISMGANAIEELTHNMCYLFGRSTTAVSLCPPAYYADLLCERGRHYLRKTFAAAEGDGQSVQSEFNIGTAEWAGGVKQEVADSMFYI